MLLVTYQFHCSPADVWAPSKNLINWWSIVSVTNSADIRVYSYGFVRWQCWWCLLTVHLKISTPSRFVMCTKHDHLLSQSLLIVLNDYASLAPYSNIILYHSWLTHPNGSYFHLDILHPYAMLICTFPNPTSSTYHMLGPWIFLWCSV